LCIDVDGTLLRMDLLFESILLLVKHKPWLLLLMPLWLTKGKAYLKKQLASYVSLASVQLRMHDDLVRFLKVESENGRHLVLCSASDRSLVEQVANRLAFPVEVLASDGVVNLKGEKKAQALTERFGVRGFDYVGNGRADLPVWRQARQAIVVGASAYTEKTAREQGNVTMVFPETSSTVSTVARALRVHQWVKNILVFAPLVAAHQFLNVDLILLTTGACLAMCSCASGIYIINDLADIDSDRRHPFKRRRPFANGELPIATGLIMAPLLVGGGIALSLLLPWNATLILLSYVGLSTAYTYWLKEKLLADVITLAALYTIRIIMGGVAGGLLVSPWFLSFSLFLFISLAFIKRVTEMIQLSTREQKNAAGRGYYVSDTTTLAMLGIASGFLSCLVLSLYINGDSVRRLYAYPEWLWLLVPLLLYWIGRLWITTMRGQMTDDPIVYLFKDRRTYATIVFGGLILLLAKTMVSGIPGVLK
jgi:4-hydroxybenzoate polyprenyltransferase/phosphoserine phosphatase